MTAFPPMAAPVGLALLPAGVQRRSKAGSAAHPTPVRSL